MGTEELSAQQLTNGCMHTCAHTVKGELKKPGVVTKSKIKVSISIKILSSLKLKEGRQGCMEEFGGRNGNGEML